MARANRMQMLINSISAIVALLFVACGLLARSHEASTLHTRERTGVDIHASALTGDHSGHHADIHGQRSPDASGEACALLTVLHQPVSADVATPATAAGVRSDRAPTGSRADVSRSVLAVYRLAPKTSPPATV
jgi:hypothetical protein